MPARPIARRRLSVTLSPLSLIGCIALGLWFGFVAIALTCWLIHGRGELFDAGGHLLGGFGLVGRRAGGVAGAFAFGGDRGFQLLGRLGERGHETA